MALGDSVGSTPAAVPQPWGSHRGVLFARAGSWFTRDFEDLVGWLATTMDKTALRRLMRIDWDTIGQIIDRVIETGLDPKRLDDLFVIGGR
jgi:transposase